MSQTVEQLESDLDKEIKDLRIEIEDVSKKLVIMKRELENKENLKLLLFARRNSNR